MSAREPRPREHREESSVSRYSKIQCESPQAIRRTTGVVSTTLKLLRVIRLAFDRPDSGVVAIGREDGNENSKRTIERFAEDIEGQYMAFCEIGRHSATKSQTTTATLSPENSISKQYTRSSLSVLADSSIWS